jgi:hypothetical protein
MLMAWSRSEAEDEVAERRRRYGSACKRQRRVGPHKGWSRPETCLTSLAQPDVRVGGRQHFTSALALCSSTFPLALLSSATCLSVSGGSWVRQQRQTYTHSTQKMMESMLRSVENGSYQFYLPNIFLL